MNTKALRQKVLDLAIHGKLVPQNPNDESAEVLLKKIREEKAEKIKKGELKADKKDSFIFVGSDKRHYEQFADGTIKDIEDEIPFEVPEGWAWCRLSMMVSELGDGLHGTPNYNSKGQYFFVNGNNLANGKIEIKDDTKRVDDSEYQKYKKSLSNNTILVSINGTLGNVAFYNNEPIILGKSACYFNLLIAELKQYCFYFLISDYFKKYAEENATGSTIKNVSLQSMRSLLIPLPPLNQQERIITAIEKAITKIDFLEQNQSDLQTAIKQAKSKILDLAIHGKLVPQDPNDEPAEELLKRIATSDNRPYEKVKLSEIDWTLPNNWCFCHFGDIATVINGKNQSKVENPNGKYPIYGSGGIMGRADDYICPENCTIIGRKGSINNPIFVEEKFWNVDTAFGLSPSEAVLPRFLFYFCKYFDFTTLDSSTTLPSLTKTNIQQIIFALPPIEEQKRILDKTNELFRKLDEIVLNLV